MSHVRPRRHGRWSARLAAVVTAVLVSVAGALVNAQPAAACCAYRVIEVPCPHWAGSSVGRHAEILGLVSSEPDFLVSEGRVAVNTLDYPITVTFTSQISETFTVAVAAGVQITKLVDWLQINISTTITVSTTSQIGVSAQAAVQPFSRVYGDYGVDAYRVTYDIQYIIRREHIGGCWVFEHDGGYARESTVAPTYIQGWRVREG